jgi:hypothetical protein
MPVALVDAGATLVAPGSSPTNDITYAGVRLDPLLWPVCAWCVGVQSVAPGPTYTFTLEVSSTAAGVYQVVSTFSLLTALGNAVYTQGISASAARLVVPNAHYARVRIAMNGGGRALTFGSWLSTEAALGRPGTAHRPGDVITLA